MRAIDVLLGPYGLGLIICFLPIIFANPVPQTQTQVHGQLVTRQVTPKDFYLRLMPLGASITYGKPGDEESEGRGYRKFLRDKLRSRGWKVNMVGSQKYGNMADNDVEGWPGYTIDQVKEKAEFAVPIYKPNLILINAGTNDALQNRDLQDAGLRMEQLVLSCFADSPDAVVILSTLLPNLNTPDAVSVINRQYRDLVGKMVMEGYKIHLADMDDGFIGTDLIRPAPDGTHPNIVGQSRMAAVWHLAIEQVEEKEGWLKPPSNDVSFQDDAQNNNNQCEKNLPPRGKIMGGNFDKDHHPVVYSAQLVNVYGVDRGGERDELIVVSGDSKTVNVYVNYPGLQWNVIQAKIDTFCINRGIRWGDNNDGLDDFICIDPSGNISPAIDVGKFKEVPAGYSQKDVRLGDIDGDGRLDYCVINSDGSVNCWRNGGTLHDRAEYWQDLGTVFTPPQPIDDIASMRFVDINGDFRSDILWVDETGRVRTWINQRGTDKSMTPYWDDVGVTHGGMGENVGGRQNIGFGRMYSGLPSYLRYIVDCKRVCEIEVRAWENLGGGGKYQKGDGAVFGDMTNTALSTGNDDYVWISPEGGVAIFPNVNTPPSTAGYPDWGVVHVALQTGMDRKALHIGDWNGDGFADVIGVDKKTGSLTVWLTSWRDGKFSFSQHTSTTQYCTQGWGVGRLDIGAHFKDLTGSGCVDYLCMEPNGRTTAWLNDCKQGLFDLRDVGQIKFAEKQTDRANLRFADVNGDGMADYLWVDKFNGDTTVWINGGERPEVERSNLGGSVFLWHAQGAVYHGSARGTNLHFANLGGIGRADMIEVDPNTAQGKVWFNSCPGGSGGDDNGITPRDPQLPSFTPTPVCPVSLCYMHVEFSTFCQPDEMADDFLDPELCDTGGLEGSESSLNDFVNSTSSQEPHDFQILAKRPPYFNIDLLPWGIAYNFLQWYRRYPGVSHLGTPSRGQPATPSAAYQPRREGCESTHIEWLDVSTLSRRDLIDNYDTEHNPDKQMLRDLGVGYISGYLPDGSKTAAPPVPFEDFDHYWNQPTLPEDLPRRGVRGAGQNPMSEDGFNQLLTASLRDLSAQNRLLTMLGEVIGVWRYVNEPITRGLALNNTFNMIEAARTISRELPALGSVGPITEQFIPIWYRVAVRRSIEWMEIHLDRVIEEYTTAMNSGLAPPDALHVLAVIRSLRADLVYIQSPLEEPPRLATRASGFLARLMDASSISPRL
ncbi:hypothetical protein PG995_014826 [Apiospora arundinis]